MLEMENTKAKICRLAVLIAITACSVADAAAQELVSKVDEYMNAKVKAGQFSGSILIAQNGKVLVSKGYGMANLELNVPNTPQTKFRLGSLTKQFTATGIMILQERGKLNVQDPICKYVPQCPQGWQTVTIHYLLTHTSGIPDLTGSPDFGKIMLEPLQVRSTIERFSGKVLEFKPGKKFSYNNIGYVILGYIIEQVSGKSYEAFLRENIFEPLKMSNSGVDHTETILKNRATAYAREDNGTIINVPYIYITNLQGGGSLYSTVEDMLLWDQALYTEKLVSKKSLDAIFTPYIATPFDADYGYGWFIYKDKSKRNALGHTGGIYGFRSRIARYPNEKVFVMILSNINVAPVDDIGEDLAGLIFNQRGASP
jgi:CubicO group peptidase (beta-lactamase class C family)